MSSKLVPTKERSAPSNSWKTVQDKNKAKKKIKLALIVLGLVATVILIGNLIKLTQTLFSPWKLSSQTVRNYIWDGEFNLNLVLLSNPTSVLTYNSQDKKIVILEIPAETYVEVPSGYGKWQLRAVYELGQQEGRGGILLKDTLSSFLALSFDGFLEFSGPFKEKKAGEILNILRSNPLGGFAILKNLQTDLTLFELLRFELALMQVRFDKIESRSLLDTGMLDKSKLADNTEIFLTDPVKLDSVLSDFIDPKLKQEGKSIAIFNATSHPQLAQKAARIITNLGGNVIITGNHKQTLKKTVLFGEQSKTLKKLLQIFVLDCPKGKNCDKIELEKEDQSSRAQINLFLGEDFYLRL